jgi:hypothetical protein
MAGPSESGFEGAICASLVGVGGYVTPVKMGPVRDAPQDLDVIAGIDTAELFTLSGRHNPRSGRRFADPTGRRRRRSERSSLGWRRSWTSGALSTCSGTD